MTIHPRYFKELSKTKPQQLPLIMEALHHLASDGTNASLWYTPEEYETYICKTYWLTEESVRLLQKIIARKWHPTHRMTAGMMKLTEYDNYVHARIIPPIATQMWAMVRDDDTETMCKIYRSIFTLEEPDLITTSSDIESDTSKVNISKSILYEVVNATTKFIDRVESTRFRLMSYYRNN